jgi:hypothetical protein
MKMVQLVGAIAYDVRAIKHNTQNPTPNPSPQAGRGAKAQMTAGWGSFIMGNLADMI